MTRILQITIILCLMLTGATWLATPSTAYACTPPPGGLPNYTIADRVERAPIVLEGSVVEIFDTGGGQYQIAIVEVAAYYKGNGPAQVAIANFGAGSLCLSTIQVGGPYLIYADGDDASGYSAFYASQFDAYTAIGDDSRATVMDTTGTDPITPEAGTENLVAASGFLDPPPVETEAATSDDADEDADDDDDDDDFPVILIAGLVAAVLVVASAFVVLRGRGQ